MEQTVHLKRGVKIDTSGARPGGELGARSQTFFFCPFKFLVSYGVLVVLVQE